MTVRMLEAGTTGQPAYIMALEADLDIAVVELSVVVAWFPSTLESSSNIILRIMLVRVH